MKILLRYELPSPELDLVADSFAGEEWEVSAVSPWDVRSYTDVSDVAFCLGPVSSCPLSEHRVLMVLGQVKYHSDMNWDLVLVTSSKARRLALAKFGHGTRVVKVDLPLVGTESGSKMIVDQVEDGCFICASEVRRYSAYGDFALWANLNHGCDRRLFCLRTFNGLIRGGGVGCYEDMEDGYDIQVRRHLALGGKVVCPRDREVIGDLADVCFDGLVGIDNKPTIDIQDCIGSVSGFSLTEVMGIL